MLFLFKSNQTVSVCLQNSLAYRQDQISLSDPPIPGTPEMDCSKPFFVTLEKLYHFVCSHCLQSTSKPHWIHMKQEQSLIQFRCQKVHMHVWIPKVAHIQGHLIFKLIILRYWLRHFIILFFLTCNSYFLNFL